MVRAQEKATYTIKYSMHLGSYWALASSTAVKHCLAMAAFPNSTRLTPFGHHGP
jgi:hypothetical protein